MLSGYPASCDRAGSDPSRSQSPQPPRQQSHRFSPGSSPCAIIDAFWQTETGNIVVTPFPGAIKTKPTLPFFGMTPLSSTHHMKGASEQQSEQPPAPSRVPSHVTVCIRIFCEGIVAVAWPQPPRSVRLRDSATSPSTNEWCYRSTYWKKHSLLPA
ncbi:hypothetical protein EDB84DRAFT_1562833 [Lactarius hengduanensis]|nr:hypothetical protein EDB84DRAFT_1562833 [Lactarius hengduanensis]